MRALVFVAVMLCIFATGVSVCAADYSVSFSVRYEGVTAERAAQVAQEAIEKYGGWSTTLILRGSTSQKRKKHPAGYDERTARPCA